MKNEGSPLAAPASAEVTRLLLAWRSGEGAALDRLVPMVYAELHRLAHRQMRRERPGHTLQTSALVNETYLRLVDSQKVHWQNRAHFFAVCAQLMRRILVDHARTRGSLKRGGGAVNVALDEARLGTAAPDTDLLALDEALTRLAAVDLRKSRVVELRYFGGLSVDETAEALAVSPETVLRDWRVAKLWLLRELKRRATDETANGE